MFTLLNVVFAALRVLYTPAVADLDSPRFETRQAALKTLWNAWPLSHEACQHAAAVTESPEARARVEHVTEAAPGFVWRKMIGAPADCWDETLAVMLADDYERDGLPQERDWAFGIFAGHRAAEEAYSRLLARGVRAGWLKPADVQEIESLKVYTPFGLGGGSVPMPAGVLPNFTEVRFRSRGLPTICEWMAAHDWRKGALKNLAGVWRFNKSVLSLIGVDQ